MVLAVVVALAVVAVVAIRRGPAKVPHRDASSGGSVIVYGLSEPVLRGMTAEAPKALPEIELKTIQATPTDFGARLLAERQGGQTPPDVVFGGLRDIAVLLDRDFLAPYDYASLGVPADRILFGGRAVASWNVLLAHAFNKNEVKDAGELPKKWADLLDARWKGRLVSWEISFVGALAAWALEVGEDKATELAKRLVREQDLLLTRNCVDVVASGERALCVGCLVQTVLAAKDKGRPVDVLVLDGQGAVQHAMAIPRGAANAEGGARVVRYVFSSAGREMLWTYAKVADAHPDARTPYSELLARAPGQHLFETPDNYRTRADIADRIRRAVMGQ